MEARVLSHAAPLLLVEDEPLLALALSDELERANFAVHLCSSGYEAITRLASESECAALVTDINLGEGPDGWEVARFARARFPAVSVIYVTGSDYRDHALFGTSGSILLEKPVDPRRLVSTLHERIGQLPCASETGHWDDPLALRIADRVRALAWGSASRATRR
jgi:DNA-binding response OmpR family regulator